MKDMGWDKFSLFLDLFQRKQTRGRSFNDREPIFKIMLLVVQYQDHWLRSSFKKEIPFPANKASFCSSRSTNQMLFETRTYLVQLCGRVVKSVAEMNT